MKNTVPMSEIELKELIREAVDEGVSEAIAGLKYRHLDEKDRAYYSKKEVMEMWGVCAPTVDAQILLHHVQVIRHGKYSYYSKEDIDAIGYHKYQRKITVP